MITLYGFGRVNSKVVGLTRDLRVLWALEELELPYRVHGVDHPAGETRGEAYQRLNPFRQVPVLDDDGFVLTETGAILLYLAEKTGQLMPTDLQGRAQVTRWCFAALTTVELPLSQIIMIDLLGDADPTGAQRRPGLVKYAEHHLAALEDWLRERPYVAGEAFTVADILMTTVLREVRNASVLEGFPRVCAYRERCEARPAWKRTLEAYEQRLGVPVGTAR
ncbi:glutathione S-transferase family protein [Corallococcus sp. CA049B]|uniref:glutathione S-transferase family protein n=1 Tax=Corallococcus sp. CA049B TaxID=2316730 RepID=UPI000EA2B564|nr:glutathione S-transferase family protein [Corallococcus sp. CA049B]NOJ96462.1 glutathione S-transferase family protein [Corallococcus coralloides]RKG86813.1 glutathione S-transferase family protein [Corallococcus sp. CA049B]